MTTKWRYENLSFLCILWKPSKSKCRLFLWLSTIKDNLVVETVAFLAANMWLKCKQVFWNTLSALIWSQVRFITILTDFQETISWPNATKLRNKKRNPKLPLLWLIKNLQHTCAHSNSITTTCRWNESQTIAANQEDLYITRIGLVNEVNGYH